MFFMVISGFNEYELKLSYIVYDDSNENPSTISIGQECMRLFFINEHQIQENGIVEDSELIEKLRLEGEAPFNFLAVFYNMEEYGLRGDTDGDFISNHTIPLSWSEYLEIGRRRSLLLKSHYELS